MVMMRLRCGTMAENRVCHDLHIRAAYQTLRALAVKLRVKLTAKLTVKLMVKLTVKLTPDLGVKHLRARLSFKRDCYVFACTCRRRLKKSQSCEPPDLFLLAREGELV